MSRKERKVADPEKVRKRKILRGVVVEIIVMAVGVLCCTLPLPWRLVVPIIIGARDSILKAWREIKEPPEPKQVVYCNGQREPKQRKTAEKTAPEAVTAKTPRQRSKKE